MSRKASGTTAFFKAILKFCTANQLLKKKRKRLYLIPHRKIYFIKVLIFLLKDFTLNSRIDLNSEGKSFHGLQPVNFIDLCVVDLVQWKFTAQLSSQANLVGYSCIFEGIVK